MATSSFFYGSTPGPDQSTTDQLIADLQAKVIAAEEAQVAAQAAAVAAQQAAASAQSSEDDVNSLLLQANAALLAAEAAQAASDAAYALAQEAIDSTEQDRADADAARIAAELAQANAEIAQANAETAELNAETAQAASEAAQAAAEVAQVASEAAQAAAEASEAAADISEANALSSANDSAASASLANDWATKTVGPVAGGEYSAKYHSQLADGFAQDALASENAAAASASTATTQAGIATTKAGEAATSAAAALTSENNAATSASAALASQGAAATSAAASANSASDSLASEIAADNSADAAAASALAASNSASAALASENAAATSESNAASSEAAALSSEINAAASATSAASDAAAVATLYDNFDDRYLGAKSTAPTVDNDGNALLTGAIYFDTVVSRIRYYDGTQWNTLESGITQADGDVRYLQEASNLSDLDDVAAARTNLDVPTRTGGNASGTWGIDISGTAAKATDLTGGTAGSLPYQVAPDDTGMVSPGTEGQALVMNSSGVPEFQTLTLENLPDAAFKRSVRASTTGNITLSGTQTIDGIALAVGDRVLVRQQTTQSQNGIYVVQSGAWTRDTDADNSSELAGALVNIDSGTQGGLTFKTTFKATDTVNTSPVNFALVNSSFYYRTNATIAGGNDTTLRSLLGVGVNLTAGTVYEIEGCFWLSKTAGVTSSLVNLRLGAANGLSANNVQMHVFTRVGATVTAVEPVDNYGILDLLNTNLATMGASTTAALGLAIHIKGTISVNTSGTLYPYYGQSAASGGAWTTAVGNYMKVTPLTSAGVVDIGDWVA